MSSRERNPCKRGVRTGDPERLGVSCASTLRTLAAGPQESGRGGVSSQEPMLAASLLLEFDRNSRPPHCGLMSTESDHPIRSQRWADILSESS